MIYKTLVRHWRYESGWRDMPAAIRDKNSTATNEKYFDEELKGWHCWVYPANDKEFSNWMEENITGYYESDFRFNSGDVMYTVLIKDDEDAVLFKLKWLCEN